MDLPFITVAVDQCKFLVSGDYVRYVRKDDNKVKKGFVKCHWSNDEGEGLCLSFNMNKASKKWTVKYDMLKHIEKKINPSFFFEYQMIMNAIKY